MDESWKVNMKTGDWKLDRKPAKKFIAELKSRFQDGVFLNEDVYDVYYDISYTYTDERYPFKSSFKGQIGIHPPKWKATREDVWLKMNARNYISMAVAQGVIRRIAPGVFEFPEGGVD